MVDVRAIHDVEGPDESRPLRDLIIATHRGPFALSSDDRAGITAGLAGGGLAPSLVRALEGTSALWIACATDPIERRIGAFGNGELHIESIDVRYLVLDETVVEDAYQKIASETLWFLHHGMTDLADLSFDDSFHRAFANYRRYNEAFALAISGCASHGATVMVNDYHLSLVGAMLRRGRPDLKTLHFSHTPFVTPAHLRLLPDEVARELLDGLSGFGACGFHISRWAERFRECLEQFSVPAPEIFSCPLGIDVERLKLAALAPSVQDHRLSQDARFSGKQVIVRSDRLEPTKNIAGGFEAYARLLERDRTLSSRVVFYAHAYVSRSELELYRRYRIEVEQTVERINARFGTPTSSPVIFEVDGDYAASLAAYQRYDVLLVNPYLDGMNLVAKEAPVVNTRAGAVVLSTGAGAYSQLCDGVIGVDPYDIESMATGLSAAIALPFEERSKRATMLKAIAGECPPAEWLAESLSYARRRD